MIIEWLEFWVKPDLKEKFLNQDRKIWTPVLASAAGFLSKEVWYDPQKIDRIYVIVRWRSRQQWKAISLSLLEETERKFALAMGENSYQMVEAKEYQLQ